ncbi:hypothetical protein N0V83_007844 [Neocucurbitaria cava]|uniref:Uncharacterized protein n=1 Tax=Neocucurbitaria cava TaxID=798079 RepID=A0A9W9CJM1_9PLEO|nr:hypothetical protein N0V83_007844 [Neocucurbitaria cava]
MPQQPRKPKAAKAQPGLLIGDELDVEKLWGDNIKGDVWHPRIRNIRTMHTQEKLHECEHCGHNVTRACFVKNFHQAYCTAIIRNKDGVLDFCGQHLAVKSREGCAQHPFAGGFNKHFQEARKHGVANIPQPAITTEEQYQLMLSSGLSHIPETDEEVEETTAYESDENDQKPWLRYTEATAPAYKDKAPRRARTKHTQGKKQPQMPPIREHFNEKKREKAVELKNETRTEFNYPNGARVLQVATNTINARDTELETKKETEREPIYDEEESQPKRLLTRGNVHG